jgi:hypothetical protein
MDTHGIKGQWVEIHQIVLKSEEREANIPEDTKKVPLELWVKGYLNSDANIGDLVYITTVTGRILKGELVSINPRYTHDFGEFVPELKSVGLSLRRLLEEDAK